MIMQLWLIRSSFPYNYLMMIAPCSAQLRRQLRMSGLMQSDVKPSIACKGDDMRHGSAMESDRVGLRNAFAHGTCLHDMYSNGHRIVGVLRSHPRILQVPLRACCSDCSLHWLADCLSHSDSQRQNGTFTNAQSCVKMQSFLEPEVGVVLVERLTPLEPSLKDWEPWLASVLLGLLLLLLMFEGRLALMRSQPDDFMGILIIMNGSMMSVVSRLPHCLAEPFIREGAVGNGRHVLRSVFPSSSSSTASYT